jgi:putative endonuclease
LSFILGLKLGEVPKRRRNHNTDGKAAELIAAEYLQDQGLRILAQNFRIRGGEVDLICQDGSMIVFVEVRLRRLSTFGGAIESIDYFKQRKIVMAARHYLARLARDSSCRFDCILLTDLSWQALTWIRDAFLPED